MMTKLRELRLKNKWTLLKVAKMLGVSQFSIIRWEKGTTKPDADEIKKLAEIFCTTPNYLLGVEKGKDDEK